MINTKMQKIISLKLNGLKEHGLDIDQEEVKIKEEIQVIQLLNLWRSQIKYIRFHLKQMSIKL